PRRWSDSVFIHEPSERLLLGLFIADPTSWRARRVQRAHFNGIRSTLFGVLEQLEAERRPFDLVTICMAARAANLSVMLPIDLEPEWRAAPRPLRELERDLDHRLRRRRANVLAEAFLAGVRDLQTDLDALVEETLTAIAGLRKQRNERNAIA